MKRQVGVCPALLAATKRMLEIELEGLESDLPSNDCTVNEVVESFVESTTRLAESLDAPEERVDDFEESGKELASLVEETAHSVNNNSDRLDEVEDSATLEWESSDHKDVKIVSTEGASFPIGRSISSKVSQTELDEIEEQLSTDDPRTDTPTETDQTHAPESSLTPIEQLSEYDDVGEVTSSPSVERAVSLFSNIDDWGSRTPKGIVLKPADNPLSLLSADMDESLCWKQLYRAAEALERLSKGAVTFFDSDRHGKTLVLHEQSEVYERVRNGTLSVSTAEATG